MWKGGRICSLLMLGFDICTGEPHVGVVENKKIHHGTYHKANWTKITHFKIYIRSSVDCLKTSTSGVAKVLGMQG